MWINIFSSTANQNIRNEERFPSSIRFDKIRRKHGLHLVHACAEECKLGGRRSCGSCFISSEVRVTTLTTEKPYSIARSSSDGELINDDGPWRRIDSQRISFIPRFLRYIRGVALLLVSPVLRVRMRISRSLQVPEGGHRWLATQRSIGRLMSELIVCVALLHS